MGVEPEDDPSDRGRSQGKQSFLALQSPLFPEGGIDQWAPDSLRRPHRPPNWPAGALGLSRRAGKGCVTISWKGGEDLWVNRIATEEDDSPKRRNSIH